VALQTDRLTNFWKYESDLAKLLTMWHLPSSTTITVPSLPRVEEEILGRHLFDWQKSSTRALTTKLMKSSAHLHPLDQIYKQYDEESKATYLFSRNGHVTFGAREVIGENPIATIINGYLLVDKTATGKKRSVMYSLVDLKDKIPTRADAFYHHRYRTSCSAMVIVTSSDKIHSWRKEVRDIVPVNWQILYVATQRDLEMDFTSADLIVVNRNALNLLGTDSLGTISLQFRIVVFDDVDELVYQGAKKHDTVQLTRKTIIAKTLFCGENNILISSNKVDLKPGSVHLDTCLYLAGAFQNSVSIYPLPVSPRAIFLADPRRRQDIFNVDSVTEYVLEEEQKLLNHGYFLEQHVLEPESHDAKPEIINLQYNNVCGNISSERSVGLSASEINAINAVPFLDNHFTGKISTSDIALFKTVAYIAEQAGNKVAVFSGSRGFRDFNSWLHTEESLKVTGGINLIHMDLPCTGNKRKRKSMEDNLKKNVLVFARVRTSTIIPLFPSITHIIIPWEINHQVDGTNRTTYDFVDHTTRYGVMVGRTIVVIKLGAF
jgi:hypothetical protein